MPKSLKVRANATDTSRAASVAVAPRVGTQREALLRVLWDYPNGLTDQEMRDILRASGRPISYGQTARRLELEEAGFVRRTDRRRTNTESGQAAIVFEITEAGRAALRR
jgi:Fe2+ or Zn2+ uptake regulation protein